MQLFSLSRRERNSNINVGSFDPNRKHTDKSRWICIYPAYLNSKKTVSEGRRIALSKAVENPTINEIKDVLVNAGFAIELEVNKVYPREMNKYENLSRGRVRVQFRNEDATLIKPNFKNSKSQKTCQDLFIIENLKIYLSLSFFETQEMPSCFIWPRQFRN
jgi:signal recognition particle subunit SRP19